MIDPDYVPSIPFHQNKKYSIALILAWPDTAVKNIPHWYSRLLDKLTGSKSCKYRYGHSAFCLIKRDGSIIFLDFGRFMTTLGFGRARSMETDPELEIPFKAQFITDENEKTSISNLGDILDYLGSHPNKTHGEGRLTFSYNNSVSDVKINSYVNFLQEQHEVLYSPFSKESSNCARFTSTSILKSCNEAWPKIKLSLPGLGTPTPAEVCVNARSKKSNIWEYNPETKKVTLSSYSRTSAGLEMIRNLFIASHEVDNDEPTLEELPYKYIPTNAQKIVGVGAHAYYAIDDCKNLKVEEFRVRRYREDTEPDYDIVVACPHKSFDFTEEFLIQHASQKMRTRVKQGNKTKDLIYIRKYKNKPQK